MSDRVTPISQSFPTSTSRAVSAGPHGPPPQLEPAQVYPAVVLRLLAASQGGFHYEVSLFDRSWPLVSAQEFAPGTLLKVVPVPDGASYRLELRGTYPGEGSTSSSTASNSSAASAASEGAAPTRSSVAPDPIDVLKSHLLREFREHAIQVPTEAVTKLADTIVRDGLPAQPAIRAARRLLELRLPLLEGLVRGGTYAELGPDRADLTPALQAIRARLAVSEPRAGGDGSSVVRGDASRLPAPVRDLLVNLAELASARPRELIPGAPFPMTWLREVPSQAQQLVHDIVRLLVEADPVLERIRETTALLQEAPGERVSKELETRVRDLLRELDQRDGQLLRGLSPEARDQAALLLRALERSRLEQHPVGMEWFPLLREVQQRAEAALYLQLCEWAGLDAPERSLVFGFLDTDPEPWPFRMTVRDQRQGDSESESAGFRLAVESRTLGRIDVAGRWTRCASNANDDAREETSVTAGALRLHFAPDRGEAVAQKLRQHMPRLIRALEPLGYDTDVTVRAVTHVLGAMGLAPEAPAKGDGSEPLDVRG